MPRRGAVEVLGEGAEAGVVADDRRQARRRRRRGRGRGRRSSARCGALRTRPSEARTRPGTARPTATMRASRRGPARHAAMRSAMIVAASSGVSRWSTRCARAARWCGRVRRRRSSARRPRDSRRSRARGARRRPRARDGRRVGRGRARAPRRGRRARAPTTRSAIGRAVEPGGLGQGRAGERAFEVHESQQPREVALAHAFGGGGLIASRDSL